MLLLLLITAILSHPVACESDISEFANVIFDQSWETILEENLFDLDPLKVAPENIRITPEKGPLALFKMNADCHLYDITFRGLKNTHRSGPIEVNTDQLEEGQLAIGIKMKADHTVLTAKVKVKVSFGKVNNGAKEESINLTIASDSIEINPRFKVNLEEETFQVEHLNILTLTLSKVKVEQATKDKGNLTSLLIEQTVPYLLHRLENVAAKKVQSILTDKLTPIINYINDGFSKFDYE